MENKTFEESTEDETSADTFSILLGFMVSLFVLNLIILLIFSLLCYFRKNKDDTVEYLRNDAYGGMRQLSGDDNVFTISGMSTKLASTRRQPIGFLKYDADTSLSEPQQQPQRSPALPWQPYDRDQSERKSSPRLYEPRQKSQRIQHLQQQLRQSAASVNDDVDERPPKHYKPQPLPRQRAPQLQQHVPRYDDDRQQLSLHDAQQRQHQMALQSQQFDDDDDEEQLENPRLFEPKESETRHQVARQSPDDQSAPPPRLYDESQSRDRRNFYANSLRSAAANYWYGNGPAYFPHAGRASVTATTGSASSLDSGYLGGSTPKSHGIKKYRIRAKVHAEDDRSTTSQSVKQKHQQQHPGFRKLTLSESQTISDV